MANPISRPAQQLRISQGDSARYEGDLILGTDSSGDIDAFGGSIRNLDSRLIASFSGHFVGVVSGDIDPPPDVPHQPS